jgi:hypothetical protein
MSLAGKCWRGRQMTSAMFSFINEFCIARGVLMYL